MENQKKKKMGTYIMRLLLPIIVVIGIALWLKHSFAPIQVLQDTEEIVMVNISQGINVDSPRWNIFLGEDIEKKLLQLT